MFKGDSKKRSGEPELLATLKGCEVDTLKTCLLAVSVPLHHDASFEPLVMP